jgi:glutathione S-transferase
MELIGQYDSPFTRRVAITMRFYGMAFEHNRWSVFGNANELSKVNPLIRVPTLMLEDGTALIETSAIIDYLDSCVAPEKRLTPQTHPARYFDQRIVSIASGVSDMAVRLFYEQRLHEQPSPTFVARITRQLEGALEWLENDRASRSSETWFGGAMTLADVSVTCALRHLVEAHPKIGDLTRCPALARHCGAFEAKPLFIEISQAFIAPT